MFSRFHRGSFFQAIVIVLLSAVSLEGQSPPKNSPFLPPPDAPAAAQPADESYSFVGMTVAGEHTLLSIVRQRDRRSTWIEVGKTVGEITVVSYDAAKDRTVIRVDGKNLTLTMRQAQVASADAASQPLSVSPLIPAAGVSTPAIPADPAQIKMPPLNAQQEKEMEARMLVTDLLEIGQRQRAAYEEAQRQAALRASEAKPPAARPAAKN